MLKPFVALLLVFAALSGGLLALQGSKSQKRPKVEDASLLLQRYQCYFSKPTPIPSVERSLEPTVIPPRVLAVVVAALVFGTAAYLGLGSSLEAAAVPTTGASVAYGGFSLHDDLSPPTAHDKSEMAKLAASAQLAPPAAPVAEPAPAPAAEPAPAPAPAEPAPAPAPAPEAPTAVEAYVPAAVPAGGIEAIICSLPWPCNEAIAVAQCESGTDRDGHLDGNWASNGNHFGIFQIADIHAGRWADFWEAWMDPARNAQYAYDIWSESGWRPWSCRPY